MADIYIPPFHNSERLNSPRSGLDGTAYWRDDPLSDDDRDYFESFAEYGVELSSVSMRYAPEIEYDVLFVPDGMDVEYE